MKNWENRALALLNKSLYPIPTELNELDWKTDISNNSERLAQHLSAFAQLNGGGFLIYGINNDGSILGINKEQAEHITTKLNNIARNNLANPVSLDHSIVEFKSGTLLIIYIMESENKPVNIRGKSIFESYKRSVGNTVKMSPQEVKTQIAFSHSLSFEEQIALSDVSPGDILRFIDFTSFFQLSEMSIPDEILRILDILEVEQLIKKGEQGSWEITNLGAILFCNDIKEFRNLKRKSVRVVIYDGTNKIIAKKEQVGIKGYASGFNGLITYIMDQLPSNEVIEHALRKESKMYPEVAIREFVANALIHQDFMQSGSGIMIEIFNDRIEITNPGVPLVDTDRFIDTPPKSRNEIMASLLRRLKICEERGSGIDRAVAAIELYQLPAPKFQRYEDFTKVTIYAHKPLSKMDKEDKIRACYQHACLMYVSNLKTNNETIRRRFNISDSNYPMASKIISETIEAGLIKPADVTSTSKRHATYLPFWG